LGTPLQDVYDSFFIKNTETDFTNKQDMVFQLFKASLGYCKKTVPESLEYVLIMPDIYEGEFIDVLGQDTIELITLFMTKELYRQTVDKYTKMKQYIGTQSFNKLPENPAKSLSEASKHFKEISDEIYLFRQEFYSYKN
jgi:hypothetical protein